MKKSRVIGVAILYAGLMIGGLCATNLLDHKSFADMAPLNDEMMRKMVFVAILLLIVISAVPFVPGAEIGFALLLVFGAKIAPLVYLAMVTALSLAFLVGRLVPLTAAARFFGFLGLRRAKVLARDMAHQSPEEILSFLMSHAPTRLIPTLLRFRYLAVIVLLNLPGNSVLGGGGGLAFAAGFTRVFSFPVYLLCLLVAVAPVPLYFILME